MTTIARLIGPVATRLSCINNNSSRFFDSSQTIVKEEEKNEILPWKIDAGRLVRIGTKDRKEWNIPFILDRTKGLTC